MYEDNILNDLILNGAVEIAGLDIETGEPLYTFTEKLAQFSPPLHRALTNYIHSEIMFLWENGFLEMDVTESNPKVRLTEKALDESKRNSLGPEHLASLKDIMNSLKIEE